MMSKPEPKMNRITEVEDTSVNQFFAKPRVSGRQISVVDDTTELIEGKFYNVRCAEMRNGFNNNVFAYVPVFGEKHKDPQFGVDYIHWHIDGRFVGKNEFIQVDDEGQTNAILNEKKINDYSDYVSRIVVKRRKCKRLTTGINPPTNPKGSKYHKWYNSMVGKSCKGKKCPHLGTMMKEINGQLVCPLHDLRGCPISEVIVCR